jgi:hypothetical protein
VLKRFFGSKFNDGVFQGWRVRRVFRKSNIASHINQIKLKSFEVKREADIDQKVLRLIELK